MPGWSPTEIALVVAAAGGLVTAISTSMANFVALWRLNTKVDGMLVARDASNVAAGTVIGRAAGDDAAAQRDAGRREQRAIQKDRDATAAALAPQQNGAPVPVADDRTAVAAERGATANERIADAAEKKD